MNLPIPSRETFRREVRRLENSETFKAKFGALAAQSRWGGGGRSIETRRILELGIQDDTPLDVFCVDADRRLPLGRPILTVLMDHHSRCILGQHVSFDPPAMASAAAAIVDANTPKRVPTTYQGRYDDLEMVFGKPSEIMFDNALYNSARSMQDSLADVGIGLRLAGIRRPTDKAPVERYFRTVRDLLNKQLPGATFPIEMMREFGYVPGKDAVLTLAELRALLEEARAFHHITKRRNGPAPLQVWMEGARGGKVDLIRDLPRFRRAFYPVYDDRTLSKSGIEFLGLRYSDFRLTPQLLGRLFPLERRRGATKNPTAKLRIKVNPDDLSSIFAWDCSTNCWIELPCTEQIYSADLTLSLHKALIKRNGSLNSEEERLEQRRRLRLSIEQVAPKLKSKERRLLAKLQGADVSAIGGEIEIGIARPSPGGMEPVEHVLPNLSVNAGDATDQRMLRTEQTPSDKPDDLAAEDEEDEESWGWGEVYRPEGYRGSH